MPTANIKQVIDRVAQRTGITKKLAKNLVEETLGAIVHVTHEHERLTLRDFGRFELRYRNSRINNSPIAGEPTVIPARETIIFTVAPGLVKEAEY